MGRDKQKKILSVQPFILLGCPIAHPPVVSDKDKAANAE